MKRKPLIFALVMILALSTCLALVGCGGSSDGGEGGGTEGGGNETSDGLVLVEDGKPTFQFVFSHEITSNARTKAEEMIKKVNKLLNTDAKKVKETHDNESEIEIIIGSPKFRADECAIDPHYLGPEGYAVKAVGKKILVLYGSEAASVNAIKHVEEVLFGIDSKTKTLSTVVADTERFIDNKQQFTLHVATVAGNDLRDYVIEYPTALREQSQSIQNQLYAKVGIWLPKGSSSAKQKALIIRQTENKGENSTPNGFIIYVDEAENLVIETEFPNKLEEGINNFLNNTIFQDGKTEMHYDKDYVFNSFDARNIYYEEFGAKGNGITDDFEAIKACHAYANLYGHTVNATPGATYYIGKNDQGTSAVIKTDVNWNGCKFIFDDREIQQPLTAEQNGGTAVDADPGYYYPIFRIDPDTAPTVIKDAALPISTLSKGDTNIGFAPGYKALVVVYNDNVRHFIRYGENADNGQPQQEIILVDKNGNVDPSTPIQWDYARVTKITVYRADDKPITVSGGEYDPEAGIDGRAHITTRYNQGRSLYTYFARNISVNRSNVIVENVTHRYTDFIPEDEGGSGPPYDGLITVDYCNDVIIQGFEFVRPPSYHVENSVTNRMGTYGFTAGHANDLTFKKCTQAGFFLEDGSLYDAGCMGSNFCKNITFDGVMLGRFDAHCGVYNVIIKDSVINKLYLIGDGTARIENSVIYLDHPEHNAISLRADYGSTWFGDIVIDGLEIRYSQDPSLRHPYTLFSANWYNHDFGYTVHMPQNIVLNDLSIVRFTYGIGEDGKRWEIIDESTRNEEQVFLFYAPEDSVGSLTADLSIAGATVNGAININPVIPTKTLVINNYKYKSTPVNVVLPTSPTFKDMKVTVDGVIIK